MTLVRPLLAASLVSLVVAGGCNKIKGGVPSTPSVPGGVPTSMPSGEVDPNTCGNYAASDAGAKLKAFLQAIKDLDASVKDTAAVVKNSCVTMGNELGMSADALAGDDTNAICSAVIKTYQDNLKVSVKAGAKLKVEMVPAKCTVNASASASASAGCSGSASAGTGGSGAEGQCAAAAHVQASLHAECTPPKFSLTVDAKFMVDKTKFDMTVKALQDGIPKLLDVQGRIQPVKDATEEVVKTAGALAEMGPKFAQSFADQATCIGFQLTAAAKASTRIQANVNVSVSVSASASGSVGG